jgi:hypothetical protein
MDLQRQAAFAPCGGTVEQQHLGAGVNLSRIEHLVEPANVIDRERETAALARRRPQPTGRGLKQPHPEDYNWPG